MCVYILSVNTHLSSKWLLCCLRELTVVRLEDLSHIFQRFSSTSNHFDTFVHILMRNSVESRLRLDYFEYNLLWKVVKEIWIQLLFLKTLRSPRTSTVLFLCVLKCVNELSWIFKHAGWISNCECWHIKIYQCNGDSKTWDEVEHCMKWCPQSEELRWRNANRFHLHFPLGHIRYQSSL